MVKTKISTRKCLDISIINLPVVACVALITLIQYYLFNHLSHGRFINVIARSGSFKNNYKSSINGKNS